MQVKITIVILTCNHEKFIGQTLESVFAQKTEFSIRVIVADDGSKDDTVAIVNQYNEKYPNKILLLQHNENKGVLKNIIRVIPEVKSDYVAILDGDDYWNYDLKLKTQVDFLDENPNFAGMFHDVEIKNTLNHGNQYFNVANYYSQRYPYSPTLDFEDVVSRKIIIPSSAFVFRTDFLNQFDPSILSDNYSTLWKISLFALEGRKVKYINECWSTYRNHSQGISKSNKLKFHLSHISFLQKMAKMPVFKSYKYDIYQSIVNEYKILLEAKESGIKKKKMFWKYFLAEINKIKHYREKLNTKE